jgi:hypothetical protein
MGAVEQEPVGRLEMFVRRWSEPVLSAGCSIAKEADPMAKDHSVRRIDDLLGVDFDVAEKHHARRAVGPALERGCAGREREPPSPSQLLESRLGWAF